MIDDPLAPVWFIPAGVVALILGVKYAVAAWQGAHLARHEGTAPLMPSFLAPLNNKVVRKVSCAALAFICGAIIGVVCGLLAGFITAIATGILVVNAGLIASTSLALCMGCASIGLWYVGYLLFRRYYEGLP